MKQSSVKDITGTDLTKHKRCWKDFIKQELFEVIKNSDSGLFKEKRFLQHDNNEKYLILYDEKKLPKKRIKVSYLNKFIDEQKCVANEIRNYRQEILQYRVDFDFKFEKKGLERIQVNSIEVIFKEDNSIMLWHFEKTLSLQQYKETLQKEKKDEPEKLKNDIQPGFRIGQIEPQPRLIEIEESNISQRYQSPKMENEVRNFQNNDQLQISEAEFILNFFGIVI